jgi:hypothetical protein
LGTTASKILRYLIIAFLIIGLLSLIGIRFEHPKSGLKSALGSADSSIAIYWNTKTVSKGAKIVVNLGIKSKDPALAIVSNVSGKDIDVQAGSQLQRVTPEKVKGKLLAILPFFGYLFKVIGL